MDPETQKILLLFLGICGPFIVLFIIVGLLSPRFKALSERNGWTVQPHPLDHRDYVFKGAQDNIQWEMEYYIYDHYRQRSARHTPSIQVIVWKTEHVTLPKSMLLVYPRRDKLQYFAHPRLTSEDHELGNSAAKLETNQMLHTLPEKAFGTDAFRELFILRTDLENLPQKLLSTIQLELSSWSHMQFTGPVVLIDQGGITIWWVPIGMRNEWLEKTVKFGAALASSLQDA
jgi:hypothetical protein